MRCAAALVAAMWFAFFACSRPDTPPPPRGPATPLDPVTTGTIEGRVTFVGTPPPSTPIRLSGDPACAAPRPGEVDAGDARVEDGRIENALVYVQSGLAGRVFERPTGVVRIDQNGCLFEPRIAAVQTGQMIEFVNGDPTLHNVHIEPERSTGMNFGMAVQGDRRAIHIDAPEIMVSVRCNVHPWMRAFIAVLDHPYFALTGHDGTFRLANVPAGDYTLAVWHERFGKQQRELTVRARQTSAVDFQFRSAAGGP